MPPPRQAPLVDNRWSEAGGRAQAPLVDNRWGEAAGQAQAPLVDNRWGGAVGRAQAPLVPDRWGGDPLTAAIIDLVLDLQRERAPGDHEPEVYGLVEFAQLIGCPLPDLHDLSQWNRVYSLVLRALGLALQARNFHRGLFRNYAVTGHGPSARISLYVDTR